MPPTPKKDDVESSGGSLENVVGIFVLFFCGDQLVLRSGVLTVLADQGGCHAKVC